MEHSFYKYQGTGNDFIIFDNRNAALNGLTEQVIKRLCNRQFGVGADGLMLLNTKEGYDFEMIYFNADGKPSTMCGNGGRCLVQFANDMGIVKSSYKFLAVDGEHIAELNNGIVRLKMADVHKVEAHHSYSILNTGSPHYVKFENNVDEIDVVKEGAEIRYSKEFEQQGINVNFVEKTDSYNIYVRTYERGVENETLSCGTGVTAAAIVCAHNDFGFNDIGVKTKGGHLRVEYIRHNQQHYTEVYLCGPATFVFKGSIKL
jgi:diaminopimelate epimerase